MEDIQLLQPATVSIQDKAITAFANWLHESHVRIPLDVLLRSRTLLSQLLRAYGSHMFREAYPLYTFDVLITGLQ